MNTFDLCQTPLKGVNLIEAGAGTGKTYTIAGLYLRLVAEAGLSVDQILVVTYTTAATEELKSRIRRRLADAKAALDDPGPAEDADAVLSAIQGRDIDSVLIRRRIYDALINFDRSAISTIHGFCHRVLQNHAFETGHLFDAQLIQDPQHLIQELADDYWRRYITAAPLELAAYAAGKLNGPEALAKLIQFQCHPRAHLLPPPIKPLLRAVRPWRALALRVADQWPAWREDLAAILSSPALKATYYGKCSDSPDSPRNQKVAALLSTMDFWNAQYPLFEGFDRFTSQFLVKATKKNHPIAQHPFLDLCQAAWQQYQQMVSQLAAYLRYLKVRLLKEAANRLRSKKNRLNGVSFDDLLNLVHEALVGGGRAGLTRSIQQRYRVALVDEFQDTDSQQYAIFSQLFSDPQQMLFLIGDPKQAIYSFRGADLFSYVRAKAQAGSQHTLRRNWRAVPRLIEAVNAIFNQHRHPFGFDAITYSNALPANPSEASSHAPMVPMDLWYLTPTEEDLISKPIAKEKASGQIVSAVAQEIVSLLTPENGGWAPEDIAVLTRTHRQAILMKAALSQMQVPAVLHSAGSIFDTPEARELILVLQAVSAPTDPRRVRTALATAILGVGADELCHWLETDSPQWQHRWAAYDRYHQTWLNFGFFRMFNQLVAGEGVKARLISLPDGERRLTNLLHLAELLHQASIHHNFSPEGLVKWLETRCHDLSGGEDAEKLRLESDARAVRIITIHKSKGLEFEVVFCPFTWSGVRSNSEALFFHDPEQQDRLTLAIGPGVDSNARVQSQKEELAENIRLLYVALTRAKRKCYLVWGRINQTDVSAPAFLFHGKSLSLETDDISTLRSTMSALSDARMIEDLKELGQKARGAIAVSPLPRTEAASYQVPENRFLNAGPRMCDIVFDTQWRIASYSAMTAQMNDMDGAWPDRDAGADSVGGQGEMNLNSLFEFPKGVRTGLFFHDLLEQWQMDQADPDQWQSLVQSKLQSYGFDEKWMGAVKALLPRLASQPLPCHDASFALKQVAPEDVVKEMVFHFPLKPLSADRLRETFIRYGNPDQNRLIIPYLERLSFPTVKGFMKGFVDMVFCYNQRYYLVDWKSNFLGHAPRDYAVPALERVMAADLYFLQYYLYIVALDAYLRSRISHYSYDRHFGGVFYIFIRGLQDNGPSTGIFHARPEPIFIDKLRALLLDFES